MPFTIISNFSAHDVVLNIISANKNCLQRKTIVKISIHNGMALLFPSPLMLIKGQKKEKKEKKKIG